MHRGAISYAKALTQAASLLRDSPTPQLDARILLEHATGLDRASLIGAEREEMPAAIISAFEELLARRSRGEPVAYITGTQEFYGRAFSVGPGVLIPRPESEMLVQAAVAAKPGSVLDLGTGSGCLLLSALEELPKARGLGTDASAEALAYAERNRRAHKLDGRAELRRLSFSEAPMTLGDEVFEVILANPPYIAADTALPTSVADFEPDSALFAGEGGLAAHREVAACIARLLSPHGSAFIEIGHDQGASAEAIYREALPGRDVRTEKDLADHPRMVAVRPSLSL